MDETYEVRADGVVRSHNIISPDRAKEIAGYVQTYSKNATVQVFKVTREEVTL